ncbi:MAG TPA: bifunctional phosphoribosylaminoimidazolecarboxamide formyltransferase/IMP cyclohydrolase [Blastocatellia bacterium]|nr:bifunctional phosphoribosylaminoimidazolecarboxamide formyltransferase/IMP cyclohydrolase [Blastocatellia bacterium]
MKKITRALVSVSDKTGLEPFARALAALGIEIVSTGGTARTLSELGIPVREISELTGFPEMLDGRVKTLHPMVHGGILHIREDETHRRQVAEHGIQPIDLVVVNLYPFQQTVAKEGVTPSDAIENIDIGGPSMIRSAAKNFNDVAVVVDPADYSRVVEELERNEGYLSNVTRLRLARSAFETTSAYDRAVAQFLVNRVQLDMETGELSVIDSELLPPRLALEMKREAGLRYGENPHQRAALYSEGDRRGVAGAVQLQGKELSYNNYLDLDAAWSLVCEFTEDTACAIIKHTNPCGAATGRTVRSAYERALATDPVSAFGSIIAFNAPVDGETATALSELFVEAIAAPDFTTDALETFRKKKNLRIMRVGAGESPVELELRRISGGVLVQERDAGRINVEDLRIVTERKPTFEETRALLFAWTLVKHVKSNAIVYASDGQLVGVGAGQMSRVDSVRLGASKAKLPLEGTVVASDAFFPFRDGLDEAASHGIRAVIQPGGSVRDEEVIAAADEHGIAMVFTGMRHFKH